MDRRTLLKGTALAGAGFAVGCERPTWRAESDGQEAPLNTPAIVRQRRDLKLVTTWPKNFPGLGTAPERVAKFITEATEGALTVKVFAAGELVPAFEAFDAVSSGAADMYHGAEYYWQGKSKGFPFFTAVPFGLNANEINAWIHYGGGQQLWDELSAKFNIKPFACANTGVQMGGWFNREINSVEDFRGLKIRMPGLGGEVLRRLGAAAVALPGAEIFQSLQTGAIDATEWVGPWNDLAFGFYRVAKYYYWPGFHEPGSQLCLGTNMEVWNSFTPAQKRIVELACAAETNFTFAEYNTRNAAALTDLIETHGVSLRRFPDPVMAKLLETSQAVNRELTEGDDLTRRIYESYRAARARGMAWNRISEEGFAAARRLPTGADTDPQGPEDGRG